MSIVAATGHRPDKLAWGGIVPYHVMNPLRRWIRDEIAIVLRTLRPLYTISGMALGVDMDFADVSIELGIPFIAAVPFAGQEDRWPLNSRQRYRALLKKAYEVYVISDEGYSRDAMIMRDHWMVDHCNILVAVFDGTSGGTAQTVLYADRVQRDKIRINPNDFRRREENHRL